MAVKQIAENQVNRSSEPSDQGVRVGWLISEDDHVEFELSEGLIVVGRHPNCEISLDSVRISRMHCCIYVNSGRVYVRDLNSTNGVKINGSRIAEQMEIRDQDAVSFAHVVFKYINEESKAIHDAEKRRIEKTQMQPAALSGRKTNAKVEDKAEQIKRMFFPGGG
jgi:pSer/pThr/pTyr-binding forkhead associated (FHA) protein